MHHGKIIAVGEIGLDYDPDRLKFASKECQQKAFAMQLSTLSSFNLPYFLHCRGPGACQDLFDVMKRTLSRELFSDAVVHSFSADEEDLRVILQHGCFVGLNGM